MDFNVTKLPVCIYLHLYLEFWWRYITILHRNREKNNKPMGKFSIGFLWVHLVAKKAARFIYII